MTHDELQAAYVEADRLMKLSNGHQFITILKTRCMHCGRSRNHKGRCGAWFQTFLDQLAHVLAERGIVKYESSGDSSNG